MASLVSIIEGALAGVASALPDAVLEMRHEDETGSAIKSSSVDLSGEAATESGAVEKSRVIVTASQFAALGSDSLVSLGGVPHIVTSLKTDPVGATKTVGLSEPLSKVESQYSGVRGSRPVRFPLDVLAEDNGLVADMTDGYSPTAVHSWTLCIAVDSWPRQDEPQAGDEVRFEKDGADVRVKVARCNRRERHFVVSARSR